MPSARRQGSRSWAASSPPISITLPGNLEPHISDGTQRQQVVDRVVDDANPHAIAGLIGPGKPLPQNVAEDDAVLSAAEDAFITGIRVAMVVGLLVSTSSFVVSWLLFPRRRDPTIEQVALEPDGSKHRRRGHGQPKPNDRVPTEGMPQ